jgi:Domain of unknown function (DUF4149)
MRTFLRTLIWLALVVWIGGLLFFGAVVAPVAFGPLRAMFPDPAVGIGMAGIVVRDSLLRLHDIGIFCGIALAVLCVLERVTRATRRSIGPQLLLIGVMLGLTAYSQFSVIPRMDRLRVQAGPAIADPTSTNRARVDFDRLHNLSTSLEGVVLLAGLGLIILYSRPELAG